MTESEAGGEGRARSGPGAQRRAEAERRRFALVVLATVGLGLALGVAVMLFWFTSQEWRPELSPLGEERALGRFDPHLKMAVVESRPVGEGELPEGPVARAGHRLHLVGLRVVNDANGSDFEIALDDLEVYVEDDEARRYRPLEVAGFDPDLGSPIVAGSSLVRRFLFELPGEAEAPALWVVPDTFLDRLLPGFDRSPLQTKLVFRLRDPFPGP